MKPTRTIWQCSLVAIVASCGVADDGGKKIDVTEPNELGRDGIKLDDAELLRRR